MTDADKEKWLEGAEEYGAPLEDWTKVPIISREDDINDTMSVPGVKYSTDPTLTNNAKPENFVQLHLATLFRKINGMEDDVETAITNAVTATAAANQAAQNAEGAEYVNATLVGMTVTITDRQNVSRSVNIGFQISQNHVYASKAAMIADAANVLAGQFCMIATTDKTSTDNATLWSRNTQPASAGADAYTFLSDLDQASSSAWADWMENYKPVIIADHLQAVSDHNTASSDHSIAQSDHSTATQDHTIATQDHSTVVTAAQNADAKATLAQQKAELADSKATLADEKAALANTAASNANAKAALADTAAQNADDKASLADEKATLADQKATLANDKAALAQQKADYAEQQGDYAKNMADHPSYIADGTLEKAGDKYYEYYWDYETQQYVRGSYMKGDDLDYSTITEEEKARLIENVKASLVFAAEATCEDIVSELT